MKRSLVFIPFILLILINACSTNTRLPPYSDEQWTQIALTQAVMGRSPEDKIQYWMQWQPPTPEKFAELEQTFAGRYRVTDVVLNPFPTANYLEVYSRCECAPGSKCCTPEHMFVAAMRQMYQFRNEILMTVPQSVQTLDIICSDELKPIAVFYVRWEVVNRFLRDEITVSQFRPEVIKVDLP